MFDYFVAGFVTLIRENGDEFNVSVPFRPYDLSCVESVIEKAVSDHDLGNYKVKSIEF